VPIAPSNLVPGTLDLLALKALSLGELHGLGIARRIEQITSGAFRVKPGSLFPALYRMERAGWVTVAEGKSENRRDAKYYALTPRGRRQLEREQQEWRGILAALALVLRPT
jgi:PadR family transcriptional regulator, regulatory protein PadR